MAAARIPSLVLKGPSTAALLYAGEVREYVDADVLVPIDNLESAIQVFRRAGFACTTDGLRADEAGNTHAVTLLPPLRATPELDLHASVPGLRVSEILQWEALWARRTRTVLCGQQVFFLDAAGCALLVVTHAARNGYNQSLSTMDLRRAVAQLPQQVWLEVASLASETRAVDAFVAGLSLLPRGRAIAGQLGLADQPDTEWLLRPSVGDGPAIRIWQIRQEPWARRSRLLFSELFPSPAFMRLDWPSARQGRFGLAVAYVARLCSLARRLPTAWRAVRGAEQARRAKP